MLMSSSSGDEWIAFQPSWRQSWATTTRSRLREYCNDMIHLYSTATPSEHRCNLLTMFSARLRHTWWISAHQSPTSPVGSIYVRLAATSSSFHANIARSSAVGPSLLRVRWNALSDSLRYGSVNLLFQTSSEDSSFLLLLAYQRIRGFAFMRYINPRLTLTLTMLTTVYTESEEKFTPLFLWLLSQMLSNFNMW